MRLAEPPQRGLPCRIAGVMDRRPVALLGRRDRLPGDPSGDRRLPCRDVEDDLPDRMGDPGDPPRRQVDVMPPRTDISDGPHQGSPSKARSIWSRIRSISVMSMNLPPAPSCFSSGAVSIAFPMRSTAHFPAPPTDVRERTRKDPSRGQGARAAESRDPART